MVPQYILTANDTLMSSKQVIQQYKLFRRSRSIYDKIECIRNYFYLTCLFRCMLVFCPGDSEIRYPSPPSLTSRNTRFLLHSYILLLEILNLDCIK